MWSLKHSCDSLSFACGSWHTQKTLPKSTCTLAAFSPRVAAIPLAIGKSRSSTGPGASSTNRIARCVENRPSTPNPTLLDQAHLRIKVSACCQHPRRTLLPELHKSPNKIKEKQKGRGLLTHVRCVIRSFIFNDSRILRWRRRESNPPLRCRRRMNKSFLRKALSRGECKQGFVTVLFRERE